MRRGHLHLGLGHLDVDLRLRHPDDHLRLRHADRHLRRRHAHRHLGPRLGHGDLRLRLLHADLGCGIPLSLLGLGLLLLIAGRFLRLRAGLRLLLSWRLRLGLACSCSGFADRCRRLRLGLGLLLLLALLTSGWRRLRALLALSGLQSARLVERGHELVELGDHVHAAFLIAGVGQQPRALDHLVDVALPLRFQLRLRQLPLDLIEPLRAFLLLLRQRRPRRDERETAAGKQCRA